MRLKFHKKKKIGSQKEKKGKKEYFQIKTRRILPVQTKVSTSAPAFSLILPLPSSSKASSVSPAPSVSPSLAKIKENDGAKGAKALSGDLVKLAWKSAKMKKRDKVEECLEKDPNLLTGAVGDGTTLLHVACEFANVELVKCLVKRGAPIFAHNHRGWNAIHFAFGGQNPQALDICAYLLEEPLARQIFLEPPGEGSGVLHYFLRYRIAQEKIVQFYQILKVLLEMGVSPNSPTKGDVTPLHEAAASGRSEAVQALLQFGANVTIRDQYGRIPLVYAIESGHSQIAETLVMNGSDILGKDSSGRSPLQCGSLSKHSDIATLFEALKSRMYVPPPPFLHQKPHPYDSRWIELSRALFPSNFFSNASVLMVAYMLWDSFINKPAPKVEKKKSGLLSHKKLKSHQGEPTNLNGKQIIAFVTEKLKQGGIEGAEPFCYKLRDLGILCCLKVEGNPPRGQFCEDFEFRFDGEALIEAFHRELFLCASQSSPEPLKKVYEYLAPLDRSFRQLCKTSALHYAASQGNYLAISRLLPFMEGIDAADRSHYRYTPLHWAASVGAGDVVCALLDRGANHSIADANGCFPIHIVCNNSHKFRADMLLEVAERLGDAMEEIDIRDTRSNTALHYACFPPTKGPCHLSDASKELIRYLRSKGSDPFAKNEEQISPFLTAISNNISDDTLKELLGDRVIDAFFISIKSRKEACLNRLCGLSFIDRKITDPDGKTPVMAAAEQPNERLLKILLKAQMDLQLSDKRGWTALHFAANRGALKMANLLIKKGINMMDRSVSGTLAFHLLCSQYLEDDDRSKSLFRRILHRHMKGGMEIETANRYGFTPLHFACRANVNTFTVRLLLASGASLQSKTILNDTPFSLAVCSKCCSTNERSSIKGFPESFEELVNPLKILNDSAGESSSSGLSPKKSSSTLSQPSSLLNREPGECHYSRVGCCWGALADLLYDLPAQLKECFHQFNFEALTALLSPSFPRRKEICKEIQNSHLMWDFVNLIEESQKNPPISKISPFIRESCLRMVLTVPQVFHTPEFIRDLVVVVSEAGVLEDLLKQVIEREIREAEGASLVFRGNNPSWKVLHETMNIHCAAYLEYLIPKIVQAIQSYAHESPDQTLQLDPRKVGTVRDLSHTSRVRSLFLNTCTKVFQIVFESTVICPRILRFIITLVREGVENRFTGCGYVAGGLYFLRFLVPGLMNANKTMKMSSTTSQDILSVSRVLQNVANGIVSKEKHLEYAKGFFSKMILTVQEWVSSISYEEGATQTVPIFVPISPRSVEFSDQPLESTENPSLQKSSSEDLEKLKNSMIALFDQYSENQGVVTGDAMTRPLEEIVDLIHNEIKKQGGGSKHAKRALRKSEGSPSKFADPMAGPQSKKKKSIDIVKRAQLKGHKSRPVTPSRFHGQTPSPTPEPLACYNLPEKKEKEGFRPSFKALSKKSLTPKTQSTQQIAFDLETRTDAPFLSCDVNFSPTRRNIDDPGNPPNVLFSPLPPTAHHLRRSPSPTVVEGGIPPSSPPPPPSLKSPNQASFASLQSLTSSASSSCSSFISTSPTPLNAPAQPGFKVESPLSSGSIVKSFQDLFLTYTKESSQFEEEAESLGGDSVNLLVDLWSRLGTIPPFISFDPKDHRFIKLFTLMIQCGADPEDTGEGEEGENVYIRSGRMGRENCLHVFGRMGWVELFDLLLGKGADPFAKSGESCASPMDLMVLHQIDPHRLEEASPRFLRYWKRAVSGEECDTDDFLEN